MSDVPARWRRLGADAVETDLRELWVLDDDDDLIPVDLESLALTVLEPVLRDLRRQVAEQREIANRKRLAADEKNTGTWDVIATYQYARHGGFSWVLHLLETGGADDHAR